MSVIIYMFLSLIVVELGLIYVRLGTTTEAAEHRSEVAIAPRSCASPSFNLHLAHKVLGSASFASHLRKVRPFCSTLQLKSLFPKRVGLTEAKHKKADKI